MTKQKKQALDMTEGNVTSLLIRYAIPFVFANLLQIVYNLVDTVIVGRFVGATGLTGVSVAGQITTMCTALTMGLVTGAQIMIAQYIGARKHDEVNYTIGSMTIYGGLVALIMAIAGILTSRWGLQLIDTPEEAMTEAMNYEKIMFIGLVFNCGYMTCSAVLRGMGDSKSPFKFIAIASVCNVILDLLFVGKLHMQAAGAALATVISQSISFLFAVLYIFFNREAFGIDFRLKYFRPRTDLCWMITKLGIPMAMQWIFVSLSSLFVQSMVNGYGLYAAAAVAVGSKSSQISNTVSNAMGQSCSTMTGQNIAARKIERVRKTVRTAGIINVIWMCLIVLILNIFTEPFIRLFNDDPSVVEIASLYLRLVPLGFIPHAIYVVLNGVILGVGNSMLNMTNSLLEGVILKIGLAYLFANILGLGLTGVFIGNMLAPAGPVFTGGFYYLSGMWTRRKLIAKRDEDT